MDKIKNLIVKSIFGESKGKKVEITKKFNSVYPEQFNFNDWSKYIFKERNNIHP